MHTRRTSMSPPRRAMPRAQSVAVPLAALFTVLLTAPLAALFAAPAASAAPGGQLQIVAHADDDLYFMNPAVAKGIATGEPSTTLYLTAGDAGGPPTYWPVREQGIRAAYAAMAGQPDVWNAAPMSVNGHNLTAVSLDGAPGVLLVFFRLPDGNGDGSGNAVTGFESLQMLWELPEGELIHSVDGAEQYTRSDLIATLVALLNVEAPTTIHLQDMTDAHDYDHSDHVHSGRFAFEAFAQMASPPRMRAYRAYNIENLPINLSAAERALTASVQDLYQDFDLGAHPNQWNDREVALAPLAGLRSSLAWVGHGAPGQCLASTDLMLPTAALVLEPCADDPDQTFFANQRSLQQGDSCLTTPATGDPPGSGSLGFAPCDGSAGQAFTLFSDGHLRHSDNQCLGELAGVPTVLPCTNESRVLSPLAQPAYAAGDASDFSAAEWLLDPARSGSLVFGDLNGDARDDVCGRRGDGVYCAIVGADGSFLPATRWTADFSDAAGWDAVSWGGTMMLGDVDGDSRSDLCGRSDAGILCARSYGRGFTKAEVWTTAFSDADGGGAADTYASLRLADLDADGDADLCGARATGVDCLLSDRFVFEAASSWVGPEWMTALALPAPQAGRTLMLGDTNGDGAADLCERALDGVHCALADPSSSAFVDPVARDLGAFSDLAGWGASEAYWRTLRLGDLSGDGQADLCGRGPDGLVCLFSIEGRFTARPHLVSPAFSDAAGFLALDRGPTIALPDLSGDGRADVCASDATALRCARLAEPAAVPEAGFGLGAMLGAWMLGLLPGIRVRR